MKILLICVIALFVLLCLTMNTLFVFGKVSKAYGPSKALHCSIAYLCCVSFDLFTDILPFPANLSIPFLILVAVLTSKGPRDWMKKKAASANSSLTAVVEAAFRRDVEAR